MTTAEPERTRPAHPPSAALQQRLLQARSIALEAGALAREYFTARRSLNIRNKGAHDWVSDADTAVEALLRSRLQAAFPGDRILGEEDGFSGDAKGGPLWVIDPIDGTTCFLAGIPQWCIILALTAGSETLLAVIYDPMADELYWALQDGGAWCNDRPIRVADATSVSEGLISVSMSLHEGAGKPAEYIRYLAAQGGMFTRIGACGLGLAYVASGRLIGLYEPRIHPWDSWAGQLLVTEAGGRTLPPHLAAGMDRPGPALAAPPQLWSALSWILDD